MALLVLVASPRSNFPSAMEAQQDWNRRSCSDWELVQGRKGPFRELLEVCSEMSVLSRASHWMSQRCRAWQRTLSIACRWVPWMWRQRKASRNPRSPSDQSAMSMWMYISCRRRMWQWIWRPRQLLRSLSLRLLNPLCRLHIAAASTAARTDLSFWWAVSHNNPKDLIIHFFSKAKILAITAELAIRRRMVSLSGDSTKVASERRAGWRGKVL